MKLLRSWTALAALVALATTPLPAAAQAARTGPTFRIGGSTSPVILPDVAYDPLHDRYLVVQGNGFIEGQLLDANGNRLNAFPVAMGFLVGGHSQTPRVAFSPDLNGGQGGYLVTWHESVGSIAQVRGKLLSHDGGALTGDIVIATETCVNVVQIVAPGSGSNWTMGAAVAYSTPAASSSSPGWAAISRRRTSALLASIRPALCFRLRSPLPAARIGSATRRSRITRIRTSSTSPTPAIWTLAGSDMSTVSEFRPAPAISLAGRRHLSGRWPPSSRTSNTTPPLSSTSIAWWNSSAAGDSTA